MMIFKQLQQRLFRHQKDHLMRLRHCREDSNSSKKLINFSSNDYLGLAAHPRVKEAAIEGIQRYGVGSTASALINGYTAAHQQLEEKFAHFLNRKRALLFNSGYHANLGILTLLAQKTNKIFVDKYIHASIIDAILLTRVSYQRYRHQDLNHLKNSLDKNAHKNLNPIIVTEGVFSMQGDIVLLPELLQIAKRSDAVLIIDDAHAIGVLGKEGKGSREFYKIEEAAVPIVSIPLGKAIGTMGAMVVGDDVWIDGLIQFARTYMYTTAMAPALAVASAKALEVLQEEKWRRETLNHLINFFIKAAQMRQLPLLNTATTPIKNIVFKNNLKVLTIQKQLEKLGFLVAAIRAPTVPVNQACLRISLNCHHTTAQIENLLDLLVEIHEPVS